MSTDMHAHRGTPRLARLVHLFLVGLLAFSLPACSDDDATSKLPDLGIGDVGPRPDTDEPDVIVLPDVDDDVIEDTTPDPDVGDTDPGRDTDPSPDVDPTPDVGPDADPDVPAPVAIRIESIVPERGPVAGGTPFVISGQGLTADTVVYFGARPATVSLVDGRLVGQTPEGTGTGPVAIKLLDPVYGQDVLEGGFTYVAALEVDSVAPARIPTDGGVEVTIVGRGFTDDTRVSFGGVTGLRHTLAGTTHLRVVAPPHAAGVVDVRASNFEGTTVLPGALTYFETLRIDAVRPAAGPSSGGQTVTLEGAGFAPGMIVEFGGAPATVTSVAPTGESATVVTPAGSAGLADVRVQSPGGDASLLERAYLYHAPDAEFLLGSVNPAQGPVSGGIDVTLVGVGLDDSNLAVRFGSAAATVQEQHPTYAIVRIPANALGVVDVSIERGGGAISTLPAAFAYVADLWVDAVTPERGPTAGNVDVVIEGEGFTGATSVSFGALAAAFTIDSDTQITATAPAHAAATVDVTVERSGLRATLFDAFTYEEPVEIYGYYPVRGSIAGGTYVELRGRGFTGSPRVEFGGVPATNVTVLDAQTLAVRTPPHASGAVDLTVTVGQETVTADTRYTYFNPGSRFGGTWGEPIQGAVNVTVFTYDYAPIEGAFVMLSTNRHTPYTGQSNADGMVTLSGPDVYGEQTITAVAPGHSSTTIQRVNAENVTIFLEAHPDGDGEPGPPPPGPPSATFRGTLRGLNKLKEPGPDEFLMAIVYTTQRAVGAENPDPGNGNIVIADGAYTLRSRVGDLALVAIGGMYNNRTQHFEPLRMGVERYLFASDGQTYQVDIELDIDLNQTLDIKYHNAPRGPRGPNSNTVIPYLDFGFEGVFGGITVINGRESVLQVPHQAALRDDLADVSYLIVGGSYTGVDDLPMSEGFARGVTDITSVIELPPLPGVPTVTSPGQDQAPINGLVEFNINSTVQPSFYYVMLYDMNFTTVWEAFLPGHVTSFRFPDFPDFSHLPPEQRPVPYPGGNYVLLFYGVRIPNFDFANFSYSDLSLDAWESYSIGFEFIRF